MRYNVEQHGMKARLVSEKDNPLLELKALTAEGHNEWGPLLSLIAAAPDLLAACKRFADIVACGDNNPHAKGEVTFDDIAALRAAIAKAEGK